MDVEKVVTTLFAAGIAVMDADNVSRLLGSANTSRSINVKDNTHQKGFADVGGEDRMDASESLSAHQGPLGFVQTSGSGRTVTSNTMEAKSEEDPDSPLQVASRPLSFTSSVSDIAMMSVKSFAATESIVADDEGKEEVRSVISISSASEGPSRKGGGKLPQEPAGKPQESHEKAPFGGNGNGILIPLSSLTSANGQESALSAGLPGLTTGVIPRLPIPALSLEHSVVADDYYRQHVQALRWVLHELEARLTTYQRLEVLLRRESCAISTAIWVREQEQYWKEDQKVSSSTSSSSPT